MPGQHVGRRDLTSENFRAFSSEWPGSSKKQVAKSQFYQPLLHTRMLTLQPDRAVHVPWPQFFASRQFKLELQNLALPIKLAFWDQRCLCSNCKPNAWLTVVAWSPNVKLLFGNWKKDIKRPQEVAVVPPECLPSAATMPYKKWSIMSCFSDGGKHCLLLKEPYVYLNATHTNF